MTVAIGIDTVEVKRFVSFSSYTQKKLSRIFSSEEINYALNCPQKSAERFAVRFAAKEAFLKAFYQLYPSTQLSLLEVCKAISITKKGSLPSLLITWGTLQHYMDEKTTLYHSFSLTHTRYSATAVVVLYEK